MPKKSPAASVRPHSVPVVGTGLQVQLSDGVAPLSARLSGKTDEAVNALALTLTKAISVKGVFTDHDELALTNRFTALMDAKGLSDLKYDPSAVYHYRNTGGPDLLITTSPSASKVQFGYIAESVLVNKDSLEVAFTQGLAGQELSHSGTVVYKMPALGGTLDLSLNQGGSPNSAGMSAAFNLDVKF